MTVSVTQVNYQTLNGFVRRFEREGEDIRALQSHMRKRVEYLRRENWQGAAAEQFESEMEQVLLPSLARLAETLKYAAQTLNEVELTYQNAEEEAARLFQLRATDEGSSNERFSLQDLFGGLPEIPGWVSFLLGTGISFIPVVGDGLDLIAQAFNLLTGKVVDTPVVVLSSLGLVADIGWLNGPVPDPVDGANLGLAATKSAIKAIPNGPTRDAVLDILAKAAKNPDEMKRIWTVMGAMGKHPEIVKALADYPQGLSVILQNGPESIEFMAKNGNEAGAVFSDAYKFAYHVFKHADEMGCDSPQAYLELARNFTKGGGDIESIMEGTDKLFYLRSTMEFAVVSNNGIIRSFYKLPLNDWLDKLSKVSKQ